MEIIKEYCTRGNVVVLRSRSYGSQLSMIMELFNEACRDYPSLRIDDCEVVHYGGRYYSGTFGIEFQSDKRFDNYSVISSLEYKR